LVIFPAYFRPITGLMISITLMWHRWRYTAFIGGLGLSALAVVILLLSAFFAGTAPHLPNDVAALETLRTSNDWAQVSARTLDASGASTAVATSSMVSLEPKDLSRRPIDNLPPHHSIRSSGD
jgi:hypothetical protein